MDNTIENVFRFVQLRPAVEPADDSAVDLVGSTEFARSLAKVGLAELAKLARAQLARPGGGAGYPTSDEGTRLLAAIGAALTGDATVRELYEQAGQIVQNRAGLSKSHGELSNVLIARKYARGQRRRGRDSVELLFRVTSLLVAPPSETVLDDTVRAYLRRPLALPEGFAATPPASGKKGSKAALAGTRPELPKADEVQRAIDELIDLLHPEFLDDDFRLTEAASARVSGPTKAVLGTLGIGLSGDSLDRVILRVETEGIRRGVGNEVTTAGPAPPAGEGDPARPYLRDVGIADLLVVKQHLKEYRRVDIAHIENVLRGEKKSRNHRAFERVEETVITEKETTQERQTELETADRFEMNRETSRTVQRDQEIGASLTISGKYGPTVDFTSNLQGTSSTSTEETSRNATTYAQDVVSRSLDRVVERVREERIRKVVREQEETNLHELTNESGAHSSGVYQFVEKVYESQVFNYGLREMFDFMVPEPASYVWHLEATETDFNLPAPPPKLDSYVPLPTNLNVFNYVRFATQFGAEGVTPPPPPVIIANLAMSHGADSGDEEGQPRSVTEKEVTVPEGYRPYRADVRPMALTDNVLTLAVTVGQSQRVWQPSATELTDVGEDHLIGATSMRFNLFGYGYPYDANANKLPIQIMAFESNSYSATAEVVFVRHADAYTNWQIATYAKLASANRDAWERHEQKIEELKAIAEAEAARTTIRFGAPPSQNQRIIRAELKKHCISIVTRQRYEAFDITQDADPPYFDFDDAAEAGSFIRFFEQAFEWDQLQYVFYPYFWGRSALWAKRFLRQDVDQFFLEFLQAGAARVVVPARPGFELALTHYLETGEIWQGEDEPPPITSPLYLPIVTEIQERTGAPQGEIAVGDPWETQVPTPLVILRPNDDLPKWTRVNPPDWTWEEVTN